MTTIKMSVEREDESGESVEIHLKVTGTHHEYVPARLHGHPDNSSPAEGGDTDIDDVIVVTAKYAHLFDELTKTEQESARELIEASAAEEFCEPEQDYEYEQDYDER